MTRCRSCAVRARAADRARRTRRAVRSESGGQSPSLRVRACGASRRRVRRRLGSVLEPSSTASGFCVEAAEVTFWGICANCQLSVSPSRKHQTRSLIMADCRSLTTESGAPVADNQNSQTAGPDGPVLLQDQHLLEKLARFNRERIPERVVHARGSVPSVISNSPTTCPLTPKRSCSTTSALARRHSCGSQPSPAVGVHPRRFVTPRVRCQVLHTRRQLRPRRQRHADLLHPRSLEVPDFIHSRSRSVHQPTGAGERVGLLLTFARGDAHVHVAVR